MLKRCLSTIRCYPRAFSASAIVLLVAAAGFGWWLWQQQTINGPLQRAQDAWTKNHLLAAKQHVTVGLERAPQNPQMLLLAARVARRLGELDEAADLLARCDQLPALDQEAVKLENILIGVQAAGIRTDVEAHLWARAEAAPPQERALIYEAMARGFMNPQTKRPTAAKNCLDKSLQDLPDNPVALRLRGTIRGQLNKWIDAAFDYRRAYELEPDYEPGQLALADSLYQAGRFAEAQPLLEQLEAKRPDDAIVLVGLAGCRASVGRLDEARDILDKLLAKEPRNSLALMERGRIALELNQAAEAEKWLRLALAADRSDRRSNHLLYQSLSLQGKHAEAKEQLAKSQRILADLTRLGEIITEDMNLRPNDPELLHELGELMLRNGQEQQGLQWLERALVVSPNHRKTHRTLAEFYERTNQTERAAWHRGKLQ